MSSLNYFDDLTSGSGGQNLPPPEPYHRNQEQELPPPEPYHASTPEPPKSGGMLSDFWEHVKNVPIVTPFGNVPVSDIGDAASRTGDFLKGMGEFGADVFKSSQGDPVAATKLGKGLIDPTLEEYNADPTFGINALRAASGDYTSFPAIAPAITRIGAKTAGMNPTQIEEDLKNKRAGALFGDIVPPLVAAAVMHKMGGMGAEEVPLARTEPIQPKLPGMEGVDFGAKMPEPPYTPPPPPPIDTPQMTRARAFAAIDAQSQQKTLELQVLQSEASRNGDHATATALDNDILREKMNNSVAKRNWQPPPPPEVPPAPVFPDTGEGMQQPNLATNINPYRGPGGRFGPQPPPVDWEALRSDQGTLRGDRTLPTPEPLASPVSGITPQMRADLTELGLTDEAINKLTPEQAQEFIGVVREPGFTGAPPTSEGNIQFATKAEMDAAQPAPLTGDPETVTTWKITAEKLKELRAKGYKSVPGLRDPETNAALLLRGDVDPAEYMRRQASAGPIPKGARTVPPTGDEGFIDIGDIRDMFNETVGGIRGLIGRNRMENIVNPAEMFDRPISLEVGQGGRRMDGGTNPERAPSPEFLARVAAARNVNESHALHQEAYANHRTVSDELRQLQTAQPDNWHSLPETDNLLNRMWRHSNEMASATDRSSELHNAPPTPEPTPTSVPVSRSFDDRLAVVINGVHEEINRRGLSRSDNTSVGEIRNTNSIDNLIELVNYWDERAQSESEPGHREYLTALRDLAGGRLDDMLGIIETTPEPPNRPSVPPETRINNAQSISEVNRILQELQRTHSREVNTQTGRDLLTLANQRILDLGGDSSAFVSSPRPAPTALGNSGIRQDWKLQSSGLSEPTAEHGPLQREPLLPFEEDLQPRAIMDEPTPEQGGRARQAKIPFKLGISQSQYDRLIANVPESDLQYRDISPHSYKAWGGFGEDTARAGGTGPPGLRVEKNYSRKFIVYRDADGTPLATAKLTTADDGGLAISSFGKKRGQAYEYTDPNTGEVETRYRQSPKADIAAAMVVEHAAKMGAALPSGSFSEFTANLIKQAKRLVVDDTGSIPIKDIVDAVKEAGYKLRDVASRLFKDESGSFEPGKMWQNVKERTGIGGTPKSAEPIKDPVVVNGRVVSKELVGKAGTHWIDEALGLAKTATTYADYSAMKQTASQILTPEYWGGVKRMIQAGWSPELDAAIHAEILKKDIFQHPEDANGNPEPSWAQKVGFKLIGSGDISTRSEMIGSSWYETGRFGNVRDNPISRAWAYILGRLARSSTRAFRTQMNYVAANRLEFLADRMADMSGRAAVSGEMRMPGVLGGANLSDIRLPGGIDFSKLRGTSADVGFGLKQKVELEDAANMNPYTNIVLGRQLSDFVRTATGQAPLKLHFLPHRAAEWNLESSAKALTRGLFAPRSLWTKFRMLNPSTYAMAPPFVRKQYLKAALASTATWLTMTKMMQVVGNAVPQTGIKVSWDPENADFGKIRVGNSRLDFGQGYLPFLTMMYRWLSGHYVSSSSGIRHQYGAGFQAQTQGGQTLRTMVGNKLEPFIAFATDLMNASEQQPFHVMDRALQLSIPMAAQDMYDLSQSEPWMLPFAAGPILAGAASQTYGRKPQPRFIPSNYDLVIKHPSLGMGMIK